MFPVQRKFLFPTRIYIEIPLFLSFNLIFGYIRRIRKTSNPFFSEKGYARYADLPRERFEIRERIQIEIVGNVST